MRKHELGDDLDVSRSTIDRGVRELEQAGLIQRCEGGFRTTLCGRIALDEYDRFSSRIDGICESYQAISELPPETPLNGLVLDGVEAVFPGRYSPNRPVAVFETMLEDADHVRALSVSIVPRIVDVFYEQLVDGEMSADVVLSEDVVERLVSRYKEKLSDALTVKRVTLQRVRTEVPFTLLLTERDEKREVGIMVYDEDGIRGLLRNDTPEAVSWGDALFQQHAQRGDPIEGNP